ncbi:MAG TPA: hypothetical protein VE961_10445 [Pyrinomonadaceae bacterium]|nr:hypothetical protein [Pyrinomonadaceae bacterium]
MQVVRTARTTETGNSTITGDIVRLCAVVLVLFACYLLVKDCFRSGLARLLNTTAIMQASSEPAERAVQLAPTDPETHYTRGLSLVNEQRLQEAVVELNIATILRPRYYYEWLDLGVTKERLGDSAEAEAAIRESIRLAPTFAQPHWQLGNLLFTAGRYPEAFTELRVGAKSNPNLRQGLVRLAWAASGGDIASFVAWAQPVTTKDHLRLALLLAEEGHAKDAVDQLRQGLPAVDDDDNNMLRVTIMRLLAAKEFLGARDAWRLAHPDVANPGEAQVVNGDFIDPIRQNDPGFGWQVGNIPNVSIAVDNAGPAEGARSLRLQFSGEMPPVELATQLVVLEPQTRYSLRFFDKSSQLVSGALPRVVIEDVEADPVVALGESASFGSHDGAWASNQTDFATGRNRTVKIVIYRGPCAQTPCSIFGELWISRFSLVKQ